LKLLRPLVLAVALAAAVAPTQASAAGTGLNAYKVKITGKSLQALAQNGFDVTEGRHGNTIEIIGTAGQARGLAKDGVTAKLLRDPKGRTALQQLQASIHADGSYDVYRPYFDHTYVGTVGNVPGGTPARPSTRRCRHSPRHAPTSSSPRSSATPSTASRSLR
jgi:hypothetical protein